MSLAAHECITFDAKRIKPQFEQTETRSSSTWHRPGSIQPQHTKTAKVSDYSWFCNQMLSTRKECIFNEQ